MSNKQRGLLVITFFVLITMLISACTKSLSSNPIATPTIISTGLFVSPFPSADNPMAMIEQFAQQTAAVQTEEAGGGTSVTPVEAANGTVITPQTGQIETPTPTMILDAGTPTNANKKNNNNNGNNNDSAPTAIAILPGGQYVLQADEFPFCIARRYGIDPSDLMQASGLTNPDIYYAGLKLVLPQNSSWSVADLGPRALQSHPASYAVTGNGDTTVNGVACKFGDVDPSAIITLNNLSGSPSLTIGTVLQIP